MSFLLFSLRGVPEDEGEDVRDLLTAHNIDFYETTAGNWGLSMPALWLRNEVDIGKASEILSSYQEQRAINSRDNYRKLKETGLQKTFLKAFIVQPILYCSYIFVIGLVIYVSIKFLYEFGL
jgi:hypothetical protein